MQEPIFILTRDSTSLYLAIAWIYHIVTILIIFSPLLIIGKTWKPVAWKHIVGATAISFALHLFIYWIVDFGIIRWDIQGDYIGRYDFFAIPFRSISFSKFFIYGPIIFLLSPFYSVWLVYRKYTWKRFWIAVGYALVVLALMLFYQYFFIWRYIGAAFFEAFH